MSIIQDIEARIETYVKSAEAALEKAAGEADAEAKAALAEIARVYGELIALLASLHDDV